MGLRPFPGKGAEKPGKCRVFPANIDFFTGLLDKILDVITNNLTCIALFN